MTKEYYDVIKYPVSTEKAIGMIKENNSLVFVVDNKSSKTDIKTAIEELFKKKVKRVNTNRRMDGRKIAYVRFPEDTPAIDLATQLGIL